MDDIIIEIRLSRAFACEFQKFWQENPDLVSKELVAEYLKLKQHYDYCINKELS